MGEDRPGPAGTNPSSWTPAEIRQRIAAAVEILARRETALASFDGLREQYAMLMEAFGELRSEHEQLVADLRGTRAELRVAVHTYARQLRRDGVPADELPIALQGVIDDVLRVTPDSVSDPLTRDILAWGAEIYQGAA